jgi:ornithine decarboxylase
MVRAVQTPFVLIDLDVVESKFHDLASALPATELCYAVKANPGGPVIERLAAIGSSFDVASVPEIDLVLSYGVEPSRISFGNTMKKQRDIAYAASKGITRFTIDSEPELNKVLDEVPNAEICVRLFHDCSGADWPLSKKFGCGPADATRILIEAGRRGATTGMSFHVGSQQRNLDSWDEPLRIVGRIFDEVGRHATRPEFVNLGGGFPGSYLDAMPTIDRYGTAIRRALSKTFGDNIPRLMAEPGRYLVADSGTLHTEVVLVSDRDIDSRRWVYVDCGVFGGLAETLGESIRYRLATDRDDDPTVDIVLAGPTCDSADIIYEKAGYQLPITLQPGDIVRIASTGAYTTSYSAIGFNGFAPLRQAYLNDQLPKSNPRSGAVSIG